MSNFEKLMKMLATGGLTIGGVVSGKEVDYEHPLKLGEPIPPCCDKMGDTVLIKHECECPGHPHQGAIISSLECDCPDRFIPMEDMSLPPPISFTDKDTEYVGDGVFKHVKKAENKNPRGFFESIN